MEEIIMICNVKDIPIYYEEYGKGKPVMCIHGYTLDHNMTKGCLEPIFSKTDGYRRIYIDLPGMGKTPSSPWIRKSEDMLELVTEFINALIPNENFLVLGQSYGGYLTLGLICKMAYRIDGVVLLCPLITYKSVPDTDCFISGILPEKRILLKSEDLEQHENNPDVNDFLEYAVIATPEVFERYQAEIQPGIKIADKDFLFSYFKGYSHDYEDMLKTVKFDKPACIITGRQDHGAGYTYAYELLDKFPRATYAVLDCGGHNLQIENEPLFSQLVKDWLWRMNLTE